FKREVFPSIQRDYIRTGKLAYFARDFPLGTHAGALLAARALRCAGEQGRFWDMRDALLSADDPLSTPRIREISQSLGLRLGMVSSCISSGRYSEQVANEVSRAEEIGVDRAPTFLVGKPCGVREEVEITAVIRGMSPYENFKTALDQLLAKMRLDNSLCHLRAEVQSDHFGAVRVRP